MCQNLAMDMPAHGADTTFEERFTGCLLGMAIGDALGVPRAFVVNRAGEAGLNFADRPADARSAAVPTGQFSLNTELALCLVETLTTSNGFVDPELALYRFENAAGQSPYLADEREINAIRWAVEHEDFLAGGGSPSVQYAGPAARAIPVALTHALSDMNIALITREVMRSVLLTDGEPEVVNGALAVAHAVRLLVRDEVPLQMLVGEVLSMIDEDGVARALRNGAPSKVSSTVEAVVPRALHAVVLADGDLDQALAVAFTGGGATHLTGAITGALCGAFVGARGIDQWLIDGLEGRAYVLMAAPALLRAAQLRAGLLFQLRLR